MTVPDFDYNHETSTTELKANVLSHLTNTTDFSIFDKIYQVLHKTSMAVKISNLLRTDLKNEPSLTKIEQIVDDITKVFIDLDGTYQQKLTFIKKLENGELVDVNQLLKPTNTFGNVFNNDTFAISFFNEIKSYGSGKKMKGPGEYALTLMSPDINMQANKGDLIINGYNVELKSATASAGGRLGETGQMPQGQEIKNVIVNFDIPGVNNTIANKSGLGLKAFTKLVSQCDYSFAEKEEIGMQVFSPIFGKSHAIPIAATFAADPTGENTILEYAKQNFEWYKNHDQFDGVLVLSFPYGKSAYIQTSDDLIKLRQEKQLNDPGISIIPSGGTKIGEFLTQVTLSNKSL